MRRSSCIPTKNYAKQVARFWDFRELFSVSRISFSTVAVSVGLAGRGFVAIGDASVFHILEEWNLSPDIASLCVLTPEMTGSD